MNIKKGNHERILWSIAILSIAIALITFLFTAYWHNRPIWVDLICFIPAVVLVMFASMYEKKTTPIIFIDNFHDYCGKCSAALSTAPVHSNIKTIQTFIDTAGDTEKQFEGYINHTVDTLLKPSDATNKSHYIQSYQRLIVLNDINDAHEIAEENKKLRTFITLLFNKVRSKENWNPSLSNIEIGIASFDHISKSPYANLDVLLVADNSLIITFPKYEHSKFNWATSIHIERMSPIQDFNRHALIFESIFHEAWSRSSHINFGTVNHHLEPSERETKIKEEVEKIFASLTTKAAHK